MTMTVSRHPSGSPAGGQYAPDTLGRTPPTVSTIPATAARPPAMPAPDYHAMHVATATRTSGLPPVSEWDVQKPIWPAKRHVEDAVTATGEGFPSLRTDAAKADMAKAFRAAYAQKWRDLFRQHPAGPRSDDDGADWRAACRQAGEDQLRYGFPVVFDDVDPEMAPIINTKRETGTCGQDDRHIATHIVTQQGSTTGVFTCVRCGKTFKMFSRNARAPYQQGAPETVPVDYQRESGAERSPNNDVEPRRAAWEAKQRTTHLITTVMREDGAVGVPRNWVADPDNGDRIRAIMVVEGYPEHLLPDFTGTT